MLSPWSATYLVDYPERAIAQLADYLPLVVRVDVPVDVLVLFEFLFDFDSGQPKYLAEPSERHYLQPGKTNMKGLGCLLTEREREAALRTRGARGPSGTQSAAFTFRVFWRRRKKKANYFREVILLSPFRLAFSEGFQVKTCPGPIHKLL